MKDKTYNGWTNYETWAVALWMDNEQGSHFYWREQAAARHEDAAESETVQEGLWSRRSAARSKLADQIKDEYEDASPLVNQTSLYSDLLSAALSEVDWHEIAEHLMDGIIDNTTEE